jgi:hypothetical protein
MLVLKMVILLLLIILGDLLELVQRPEAMGRKQAQLLAVTSRPEVILKDILHALPSPEFYQDFQVYGGVKAVFKYLSLDYSNEILLLACVAVGDMNEMYSLPLKASFFQALSLEPRADSAIIIQATKILIKLSPAPIDASFNAHIIKRFAISILIRLDYECRIMQSRQSLSR